MPDIAMVLFAFASSTWLLELVLNNVWLAFGLWAGLTGLDYVLAITESRFYRDGAHRHYSSKEEPNPFVRNNTGEARFRYFLFLFFVTGSLFITHLLNLPQGFAVLWGMVIGVQLVNLCRHIRNLTLLAYARKSVGLSGNIQYEHWYILRQSALDYLEFCLLFLILYLFWGHFVVLGAAAGCFSLGLQQLDQSMKKRKSRPKNAASATNESNPSTGSGGS